MDIDVDTQSDKRYRIFNAVYNYFRSFGGDVVHCCTFGTIGAKSAIKIACRGLKIDNDISQHIANMVKVERGQSWSISDCYYGNADENREPLTEFINAIDEYKNLGLLDLILMIEGLKVSRGSHASGIFIVNDNFYDYSAKMVTPNGIVVSQFDLHEGEENGLLKYDFLTISALTKMRLTMDKLIEDGYVDKKPTLKETYFSILDPHKINYDTEGIWKLVANNTVPDLFQFDSIIAQQTVAEIEPCSMLQLAQTNSLMRLQQQEGADESPSHTFKRFKEDITLWYKEMNDFNIPLEDQVIFKEILEPYCGVADTQELIMTLVRHPKFCNFNVKNSHFLRKSIAKKDDELLQQVKDKIFEDGKKNNCNINTLNYIWYQILRQKGYSFSILHCIAYTFIALQELVLYSQYPSIYWNCAVLNVNAGAVEIEGEEDENKNADYSAIAIAISNMKKLGVQVSLPHINSANFSFVPNAKDNEIVYSLKAMSGINEEAVKLICDNRPFTSFNDFCEKLYDTSLFKKAQVFNLIKGGAFDNIENKPRYDIMKEFIEKCSETKTSLNMQNMPTLINYNIINEKFPKEIRYYNFRKYALSEQFFIKVDEQAKTKKHYRLDHKYSQPFFEEHFMPLMKEGKGYYYSEQGDICVIDKEFDKAYNKLIDGLKKALSLDKSILESLNEAIMSDAFNKYATGNISSWEMDSLNFYYHEHELSPNIVNEKEYGIKNFFEQSEEPTIVGYNHTKKGKFPIYDIFRITGTVLEKNKNKNLVSLLTPYGVVNVKYYAGAFGHYDKQISVINSDGTKTVIESSWFKRGQKLVLTGFRRGEQFVPRTYKNNVYKHTTMKVLGVLEDGKLELQSERYNPNEED